jgi:hypothetical protein
MLLECVASLPLTAAMGLHRPGLCGRRPGGRQQSSSVIPLGPPKRESHRVCGSSVIINMPEGHGFTASRTL